ncbi:hypothetical protein EDB83DRAFT_2680001 [Lactarius deliciosus]|nr:hypothetical protein EDB83DRAFT_2680001 [Lactarius deliciosus]
MPDHPVQPQQPDNLSFPRSGITNHTAIPHLVGDWQQQQAHQEGIPLPAENVAMQGHRPPQPYYDGAHHQAQLDYPAVPYMDMRQDGRVIPAPQAFAPEVQENHDGIFGYAPAYPAVGPPQYFHVHGALPYQAPLPNVPPADGLRILADRFINSPGTRINILRIEPGPAGRFEVWIVLEMADIL